MAYVSSTVSAGDTALATQYNNLRLDILQRAGEYILTTGVADVYTLAVDAAIVAYTDGMTVQAQIHAAGTGAGTINVNSIGAKTIQLNRAALRSGDLPINSVVTLRFDSVDDVFHILSQDLRFIKETLLNAKGDLIVASAANVAARFAVGTNFYHLIADSATSSGLRWVLNSNAALRQKNMADASVVTVVAHGLTIAPRMIEFHWIQDQATDGAITQGFGVWINPSTDFAMGGTGTLMEDLNTKSISFFESAGAGQDADVSAVDATNFSLNWTKTGSPVSTLNFIWIARM